jgi:hypothetical protein
MVSETALGGVAVALAILSYGTFAVPIKSQPVLDARVDPLVFQAYKTVSAWLFSLMLLSFNHWTWTWWALLGSLVWVSASESS